MNVIGILPEYLYKFHYDENDSLKDFLNEAWSKENTKRYDKHWSKVDFKRYEIHKELRDSLFMDKFSLPIEWKNFLLKSVRSVIPRYPLYSYDFFITNIWAVIFNPGHHIPHHRHKNSLFSGVYYLQVKPPNNRIVWSKEDLRVKKLGIFSNAEDIPYYEKYCKHFQEVNDGDLFIWESHLIHEVPRYITTDENDTRISLSFDILLHQLEGPEAVSGHIFLDDCTV